MFFHITSDLVSVPCQKVRLGKFKCQINNSTFTILKFHDQVIYTKTRTFPLFSLFHIFRFCCKINALALFMTSLDAGMEPKGPILDTLRRKTGAYKIKKLKTH